MPGSVLSSVGLGGLKTAPPSSHANEFKWSLMLCPPLITSMLDASGSYSVQVIVAQEVQKHKVRQQSAI